MNSKYYILFTLILITALSVFFLKSLHEKDKAICDMAGIITDCSVIIAKQSETINSLEEKLARTQIVKVSFYHPASRGINSDSDHTNTATMTKPIAGWTVAISDELFYDGWLGFEIYIDGFGVFYARDRMDPSVKGKQIDVCVGSWKQAMTLGVKKNVVAVKL